MRETGVYLHRNMFTRRYFGYFVFTGSEPGLT